MATVINNPQPTGRTVIDRSSSDSSGWVAAIIILLALIGFGIYLWMHRGSGAAAPQSTGASINVTLPGNTGGNSGAGAGSNTDGSSGGTAQ
jgi:hypothetical protein